MYYAEFLPNGFPILLLRKNRVTKLIIRMHHKYKNHKVGTLSTKYWIMEEILEWEKECACNPFLPIHCSQVKGANVFWREKPHYLLSKYAIIACSVSNHFVPNKAM